jgi:hypothetical protein
MVDATISRVRLRDLTCPGRSRPGPRAFGPSAGPCASRPQSVTDASGIGDGLTPRLERITSRSETYDLVASTI